VAPFRLALVQPDVRLGDMAHNLERATELIRRARADDADLIVLPELALSGYCVGDVAEDLSLELGDERIAALAAEAGDGALVLGFAERTPLHVFNSAAYLQAGTLVHLHRKLYLPTYGAFEERKHFSPGGSLRAFDAPLGRLAMLVCNDAWQLPLPFIAVQDAAEMLVVPAASAAIRSSPSSSERSSATSPTQ